MKFAAYACVSLNRVSQIRLHLCVILENLIRGLDEDEVNFLDIVDKAKLDAEKQLQKADDSELSEFRERVASLQEQTIDKVFKLSMPSRCFAFYL